MCELGCIFTPYPIQLETHTSVLVSPRVAFDEVVILFKGSSRSLDTRMVLKLACMMVGLEDTSPVQASHEVTVSTVEPFRVPPNATLGRARPGLYATIVKDPSRWMLRSPTGWSRLRFGPSPSCENTQRDTTRYLDYVGGPPGCRSRVVLETVLGTFERAGDPCTLHNRLIAPGLSIQAITTS